MTAPLRVAALTLLLAIALSGCMQEEITSGITGTVTIGPSCPVETDPPDPECEDKPFATKLNVVDAGTDDLVISFRSPANGTFHVDVAPGTYDIVRPTNEGSPPSCFAGPVTVTADNYTEVDVACDSGIR